MQEPGLIDAHVHVFATTGMRGAWAGDNGKMSSDYGIRDVDKIILPPK